MIDTHCHIQFKAFDENRNEVIQRCNDKGMILNVVGTQFDTSKKAIELAEQYEWMYASIGLHPIQEYRTKVIEEADEFISRAEKFNEDAYDELATHEKVIALGETGMDRYHVPKDVVTEIVMQRQKETFLGHARIALKHDLPMVIHVREAHDDMIETLREFDKLPRGVIHCFTGNWEQAEFYLSQGLYLGFTGVVTYPPKKTDPRPQEQLQDVIEKIPLDRIVVETDSPYLAPQKYRGKRSEPWMVEEVIAKFAHDRGKSFEKMAEIIEKNTRQLFTRIS